MDTPEHIPAHPADPLPEHPHILRGMALLGFAGPVIFAVSILIADFVVPDHDWIADTISDLGAGELEWIVDIGIYAFALSLIALAVAGGHAHLGGRGWTVGLYGLIVTGLIVFLVGARNEYGDDDQDGFVIHTQLVWALGVAFAIMPWAMSAGVGAMWRLGGLACKAVTVIWIPAAPLFFALPTSVDGLYERWLGALTFVFVFAVARALWLRGEAVDARRAA
jgi:hypothetical membrane protein